MEALRTQNLILRPWESQDKEALIRHANNPKVWQGLREIFPHPYTEKEAQWWLQHFDDDPKKLNLSMEYEGEAIGGITLHLLENVYQKTAEIGYWLGEPHWGKGLATQAVKTISRWGLENWDILRIQAGVFSGNPASERVLEKAGYHREATHRRAVFKDGKILDETCYVLLKSP